MKKNLFEKIKIAIFLAILVVPGLVFYLMCAVNPENFRKLTFDESENRNPAEFPTVEEMAKTGNPLMDYYNDRVPFRLGVIKTYRKLNGTMETSYREYLAPTLAKVFYVEPTKQLALADGEESEISETEEYYAQDELDNFTGSIPGTDEADHFVYDGTELTSEKNGGLTGKNNPSEESKGKEEKGSEKTSEKTTEKDSENKSEKASENSSELPEKMSDIAQNADPDANPGTNQATDPNGNTGTDANGNPGTDPNAQPAAEQQQVQTPVIPEPPQVALVTPPAAAVESGDYFAPITSGQTLFGRDNWFFLNDGRNLAYYTGENILSNGDMAAYLKRMETLNAICAQRGIILGFIICPDKNQIYTEYMPTLPRVNTYTRVHRFADYVRTADPGIHLSYPLYELVNAKAVGQPYYKYDTHWNNLGAFVGLQNLYANMGLPATGLESVGISEMSGIFASDLARLGNIDISDYPGDKDYSVSYRPEVNVTSRSGSGNDAVYTSTTDNPNGLKLALVGDSYRVLMVPYVEKDFSQSTVMHRNSVPAAAAQIKECNVLIVECVERYDKEMFANLNQLITILQN
ncbi:MAG: hypothetical protein K5879_05530 [Lachnospiraceae bacterium]|nr:hypothetical protein [Lachnospiraceae bacterium]